MVQAFGTGFRVWGLGFWFSVRGLGFGFSVCGLRFKLKALGSEFCFRFSCRQKPHNPKTATVFPEIGGTCALLLKTTRHLVFVLARVLQ